MMNSKLKFNQNLFSFLSLSLIILFMTGCTPTKTADNLTVNNLHQVSEDVYRSGQPSKEEMHQLEKFGIKTVINLRAIHSDREEVEETRLSSYWVRMRAGKITDKKMIEVLKLINESPKPVLIHCWHGSDRTGVTIAMYRMVFQNWTKQTAIEELMNPEYGHHYNYYANIAEYLQHVDIEYIKQQVFKRD